MCVCVCVGPGVPAGGGASEPTGLSPRPGPEPGGGAAAALQGPAGARLLPQDQGGVRVHTGTLPLIVVPLLGERFMGFKCALITW